MGVRAEAEMRLRAYQVSYEPGENGDLICRKGRYRVRIVPDKVYPQMRRVVYPSGKVSDMVNLTRAKDAALGLVESLEFVKAKP
jgi:hypothetical protein